MLMLKPGMTFALEYEIVRVISAGGMGMVYEVIHLETKRRRALKVMLPHVISSEEMRARFALEAVVTADVISDHIVEVFDAGIDRESDCPFIVLELLRGNDLASRLERAERYSADEVVTYLEQAARGLERTHERGIVHRDLKPENLFLTTRDDGSPRLKILDFGVAKVVLSGPAKTSTQTLGTPMYMAPEQVMGEAKRIGPATDTYALAQIAYTLLVGQPYFAEEHARASGRAIELVMVVARGISEPPSKRASRVGVTLPTGFDPWFAKATALDETRRYASAVELIAALRRVVEEPQSAEAAPLVPARRRDEMATRDVPPVGKIPRLTDVDALAATIATIPPQEEISGRLDPHVEPSIAPRPVARRGRWLLLSGVAALAGALAVAAIFGPRALSTASAEAPSEPTQRPAAQSAGYKPEVTTATALAEITSAPVLASVPSAPSSPSARKTATAVLKSTSPVAGPDEFP